MMTFEKIPFALRMGNAAVSYVPTWADVLAGGIGGFVSLPAGVCRFGKWRCALGLLAGISLRVSLSGGQNAALFVVGWLWYLGMLVPVIGIVQAGMHARADRYTYLPQIGLVSGADLGGRRICAPAGVTAAWCWAAAPRSFWRL